MMSERAVAVLDIWQTICLLLISNNCPRGDIFTWGNFHILNQRVHHYNTTVANLSVKHRRAKPNETLISHISRTMNQCHVGDTSILSNPNGIILTVVSYNSPLFQAMDNDTILNIGTFSNIKWCSFICSDRATWSYKYISTYSDIPN